MLSERFHRNWYISYWVGLHPRETNESTRTAWKLAWYGATLLLDRSDLMTIHKIAHCRLFAPKLPTLLEFFVGVEWFVPAARGRANQSGISAIPWSTVQQTDKYLYGLHHGWGVRLIIVCSHFRMRWVCVAWCFHSSLAVSFRLLVYENLACHPKTWYIIS